MTDHDQASKVPNAYWDDMWTTDALPTPLNFAPGIGVKPVPRHIRDFVVSNVRRVGATPTVLEVGCAGSVWLPYFQKDLKWRAAGVDYSERGCALARRVLDRSGADVPIYCCDLFAPLPRLVCAFDAVVSFGLAEHFLPTRQVIEALANFVRPGGVVITMVPNMAGWIGDLQKHLDRAIYEMHVPLTPGALGDAHADAGLEVLEARYVSTADFYVAIAPKKPFAAPLARVGLKGMRLFSKALWLVENLTAWAPHSASLSPYVGCAARKAG